MHVSQFIQNKTAAIVESQPARNKKKKNKKKTKIKKKNKTNKKKKKKKNSKQTELISDHWNETQQNSTKHKRNYIS